MDEHEDDAEPEVQEGFEIETAEYPALAEGEDEDEGEEIEPEPNVDPDKAEI